MQKKWFDLEMIWRRKNFLLWVGAENRLKTPIFDLFSFGVESRHWFCLGNGLVKRCVMVCVSLCKRNMVRFRNDMAEEGILPCGLELKTG